MYCYYTPESAISDLQAPSPRRGACKSDTVQDDLLARVIFGEFVCEKQLVDFILVI